MLSTKQCTEILGESRVNEIIKKFKKKNLLEISKKPLVIGSIAAILYIIDALIAGLFIKGGSFIWVAFAFWTVFFSAN